MYFVRGDTRPNSTGIQTIPGTDRQTDRETLSLCSRGNFGLRGQPACDLLCPSTSSSVSSLSAFLTARQNAAVCPPSLPRSFSGRPHLAVAAMGWRCHLRGAALLALAVGAQGRPTLDARPERTLSASRRDADVGMEGVRKQAALAHDAVSLASDRKQSTFDSSSSADTPSANDDRFISFSAGTDSDLSLIHI